MSLPIVCPKNGSGPCIGNKCQMYVKDWRSNEEYCIIGYYSASDRKKQGEPVVDNYAAKVKSNRKNTTQAATRIDVGSKFELQQTKKPERQPKQASDNIKIRVKKSKNIMDLGDISDDYEKEFWEKL